MRDIKKIAYYHPKLMTEGMSIYDASIYMRFKGFKNSTYYGSSVRGLAELFNQPIRKISRSVNTLIKHGYLRKHHGNITATAKKKIISRKSKMPKNGWVSIDVRDVDYIEFQLRYHVMRLNSIHQQHAIKRKQKEITKMTGRANPQDSAKALVDLRRNFCGNVLFGTRGLGRLWGISHTKASQVLRQMERHGMVHTSRLKEVLHREKPTNLKGMSLTIESEKAYTYLQDGRLVADRGTQVFFLSSFSKLSSMNSFKDIKGVGN